MPYFPDVKYQVTLTKTDSTTYYNNANSTCHNIMKLRIHTESIVMQNHFHQVPNVWWNLKKTGVNFNIGTDMRNDNGILL